MQNFNGYLGNFLSGVTTTIANTETESAVIKLNGLVPVGIIFGAFTGTTLTFLACDTADGTFVALKSTTSGAALSYTVAQNTYAAIDPTPFQGVGYLKLKSGSAEGATRTLKLSLKGL
mgnify:CR=1 FL=1